MRMLTALLACAALVAQGPEPVEGLASADQARAVKSADGLWLIAPQQPGALISTTRSFSQGLTVTGLGKAWCVILEDQAGQTDWRHMWLYCSDDDGESWRRVTKTPGRWSAHGALAGEPNSQLLHVAWAGMQAGEQFTSALYQCYDAQRDVWLGDAEVLQQGVGKEDQFTVSDLGIDADGLVTVVVATHRHPKNPPWPTSWSSGLMVRRPERQQNPWAGPFPVHTNRYAVWANLQLHDGRAHVTYRTSPSHSMIGYRSFSLATESFDQPADIEVSVLPNSGREIANASALVVGPLGGRTVAYPAAGHSRAPKNNGQLLIAFAGSDNQWQTEVLCEDPQLQTGNVSHEHFALVRGPGPQVIALYSKVSEEHRVLYRRILEHGKPMEAEREIARSDVRLAYHRIVSVRDGRFRSRVWAVVAGQDEGAELGVRAVLAPRAMKTRWQ